ncbi:MAG: glycosyltransferase, partial [Chloroflexi bacterium]
EAILQEIDLLRRHFGGDLVYLNPNIASPVYIPRLLFGFHRLRQIRAREQSVDLHHLYNADPFPFAVANFFRRPVVYSVSSGVGRRKPVKHYFNHLAAVTVSDERSLQKLRQWGVKNCYLVRPGIDTGGVTCTPQPLGPELRLVFASAPWTKAQFRIKGVDALLEAVRQRPYVRLICVWRGLLVEELEARVRRLGLGRQVEIINRQVDINEILAQAHAVVNLVTIPEVIRSYPHSLVESLAAGKPVIVSQTIPMADYVAQKQCGVTVPRVTAETVAQAIDRLAEQYDRLAAAARNVGGRDFSVQGMIESFARVYRTVLGGRHAP